MQRYWLEKRRDTFHFRGALKRLGMRFDGEKRLWYAESPEVLQAALKMLAAEAEPPAPPTPYAPKVEGKLSGEATPEGGAEEHGQCTECGFTGGEHSKGCANKGDGEGEGEGEESESESENESEGQGNGDGDGDGPKPFITFASASMREGMAEAARQADVVLAMALKQSKASAAEQKKTAEATKAEVKREVAKVKAEVKAEVEKIVAAQAPKVWEIKVGELPAVTLENEFVPDCVAEIVAWLKIGKHVRLVGPAGSGKSYIAELAARVLQRRFGFVNFSEGADESHLYGFRDITENGTRYVVPELCFADLYENGGLWLGDEYDRANPNVIVSLNGALANGHLALPKRQGKTIATKHEDFGCIVTSNTWGTGPNSEYVSANRLDASSLDRFRISTIYVDYNRKLEAALMPDKELLAKLWHLRDTIMSLGLKRIISTRFVKDAADCVAALGWNHDRVMAQAVLDWNQTDRQKVGLA